MAKVAKKYNIPVIALAGNVGKDVDILYDYGFNAIFPILPRVETLEEALSQGKENLEKTSENIARLIKSIKK